MLGISINIDKNQVMDEEDKNLEQTWILDLSHTLLILGSSTNTMILLLQVLSFQGNILLQVDTYTGNTFSRSILLQETPSQGRYLYRKHLLQVDTFTGSTFSRSILLQDTPSPGRSFYRKHLLQVDTFTGHTFSRQILLQETPSPGRY